jgi:hypothetical protein
MEETWHLLRLFPSCAKKPKFRRSIVMKIFIIVFSLFILFAFVGCATLPLDSSLQKPVSMTQMKNAQGNQFAVTKQALWLFWGLVPISVPKVDEVVGPAVADHEGVQNLKITTEYTILNVIISAITSGVLYSQTVTIQGTVYD